MVVRVPYSSTEGRECWFRPLQLNTLFLGPDRPYFQRKLLLVLRSEVGFNYVLSMRNRLFEISLDY